MKKRIMIVHKDRCNPKGCGGYLCMRVSPSNKMGKEAIVKSSDGKVEVNEEVITDADRIAANKCPFDALSMINLPEKLTNPIHRYGKNGFVLFKLPIPVFGKVTGIIGKNGIGKTTALKILSGQLKPNMASENEASEKEIIDYFKGSEAQSYFEKLFNGKIQISYKPQQVDLIPKNYNGSVQELLEKIDEKKELEKITKQLDIGKILDHDIKKISGGELQRVAIAATVLKKANVYFFDEPTSYLDIKQRLKVSKFLRELADENTAVLVVEHDLIILDYLADLIHIVYGKETEYGIFSGLKSSKSGINSYLSGMLKEENIQFRSKAINFGDVQAFTKQQESELTNWNKETVTFDKFKLDTNKGSIKNNEIIGIVGENGIGKTCFVNLISKQKLKISYKPQYLDSSEELVRVVLKDAIKDTNIMKHLELEYLLDKQLDKLSGGELQRVIIAKTLAEDTDLILMDEPSAYLDIEQRLAVSKLIDEHCRITEKAAIIVDHDLLFLDHISDNLLVFEGIPAEEGSVTGPFPLKKGMNIFLEELNISFRRDEETRRPRANKPDSQMDRKQKQAGNLYA